MFCSISSARRARFFVDVGDGVGRNDDLLMAHIGVEPACN
jgi:hypothetical protein